MDAIIDGDIASARWTDWHTIPWAETFQGVRRLQIRIAKAAKDEDWRRVRFLQRLLVRSTTSKAVAVRRVTENQGRKTPGVDGITWSTPKEKVRAIAALETRGYRPKPLRRVHIPKANGGKRPLGIPTMKDRAMQALYWLALDPVAGLGLARKMAMLSYKSEALLTRRHGRRPDRNDVPRFDVEGFLAAQATKLVERIDAATYATLTHAMDSFDLRDARWPEGTPPITFVGISSDTLFPAREVRDSAERIACAGIDARYIEFQSEHGHDAFLADDAALARLLARNILAGSPQ